MAGDKNNKDKEKELGMVYANQNALDSEDEEHRLLYATQGSVTSN